MNVKNCMSKGVKVIEPKTSIKKAAKMMKQGDFGAIPVGENDRLKGMVTDRDLVLGVIAEGRDPETATVGDVMSKEVLYCFEDDSLEEAAELMAKRQVRRLFVLNDEKRFVGILSLGDLALADRVRVGQTLSKVSQREHREPARH